MDATIPANTTAELTLPEQTETLTLGSGSYRYEYATETSLEIDRYSLETPLHIILGHPAAQTALCRSQYRPGHTTHLPKRIDRLTKYQSQ